METEIQIKQKCTYCENGMIQALIWEEFWEQPNAATMTGDEVTAWFRERGLLTLSKEIMGRRFEDVPPEEIPCGECEGAGIIKRWIPIDELRRLLGPGEMALTLG